MTARAVITLSLAVALLLGGGLAQAFASWNGAASVSHTVGTARIFRGARTTSAWNVTDTSTGTTNASSPFAAANDGLTFPFHNFVSTFVAANYADLDYNAPLPASETVSAVSLTFSFQAAGAGNDTTDMYFEVRRASTNALLATHYSAAVPLSASNNSYTTATVTLSEITTSDQANDLRIRMYMRDGKNFGPDIDVATVSYTMFGSTGTLYPTSTTDHSGGAGSPVSWQLAAAGDSRTLQSAATWPTAYTASKYVKVAFPAYLPGGSTVTAATVTHTFASATAGINACYYFDVFNNATLIGTHGSTASPYCSTGTTNRTDAVALPEVTTDTIADNLNIKLYTWTPGTAAKTNHDLIQLSVTYSLT